MCNFPICLMIKKLLIDIFRHIATINIQEINQIRERKSTQSFFKPQPVNTQKAHKHMFDFLIHIIIRQLCAAFHFHSFCVAPSNLTSIPCRRWQIEVLSLAASSALQTLQLLEGKCSRNGNSSFQVQLPICWNYGD